MDGYRINFVNDSVFIIDPPRPVTGQGMFKWFWFADAFKR